MAGARGPPLVDVVIREARSGFAEKREKRPRDAQCLLLLPHDAVVREVMAEDVSQVTLGLGAVDVSPSSGRRLAARPSRKRLPQGEDRKIEKDLLRRHARAVTSNLREADEAVGIALLDGCSHPAQIGGLDKAKV